MRPTIALITLFIIAAVAAVADDVAVKKAIETQYARMSAGYKKGDINAITRLMLATTAKSEAPAIRSRLAMMKAADVTYKITAIKSTSEGAVVSVITTFTAPAKDSAGKARSLTVKEDSIDTWMMTPQGWKLKHRLQWHGGGRR